MTAWQTNEDDIIDLTELVEAGKTPAEEAEDAGPQEQPRPLPGNLEGDIDSLLAQMEAAGAGDSPQSAPAGARPVVDPNEKIDMSGMMEVDDLLSSLNIPPPPGVAPDASPAAKEDSPPTPAKNSAEVDDLLSAAIDHQPESNILDGLLNNALGTFGKTDETPAPEVSAPEAVVPEALAQEISVPEVPTPEIPALPDVSAPEASGPEAAEDAGVPLQDAGADEAPPPVVEASLTAPELPEGIPDFPVDATLAEQEAPAAQEAAGEEELAADLEALLASVGRPSAPNSALEVPEAAAPQEAEVAQPPVEDVEFVARKAPLAQENLEPEADPAEARFAVVKNRLSDLEERLSDLENRLPEAQPAVEENRLNDLEQRLSDMENRLENTGRAGDTEQLEEMERRLTVLESRPIEVKCYQGSTDSRLIGLESRMDNLVLQFSERVEKAAASAAARILREELAALLRGGAGS
ncbi:MAG: hypothetical protein LBB60_05250 [Desulfovibrio sp.]|jgi:hypothetical protein|nr:hypothetical protein [Desulfovibrio sp.]